MELIDWNQAIDRQCPELGVNSFVKNGVRKSVIVINYFQNREMKVKWHGHYSQVYSLPGGGPQGCYLGQLEYGSQSNDSGQCVSKEDRYKFVDDMSLLEWINLISCWIYFEDIFNPILLCQNTCRSYFGNATKLQ